MNIEINNTVYNVPDNLIDELIKNAWPHVIGEWEKVPQTYRIAAKPVARAILYDMEKRVRLKSGDEKAIAVCRPLPGKDPVEHFLWLLLGVFSEGLKHASTTINSEAETNRVASIAISFRKQGEGDEWRPLATYGNVGER